MVYVALCEPNTLPAEATRARTAELHGYTQEIMRAIARKLPVEYRGVYGDI
jgi:hypothetical protein